MNDGTMPLPYPVGEHPAGSVWPTGQHSQDQQLRRGGYVPATRCDAERIPPVIAAHAIATYSRPGDTVVDPDCGAGTVLVEALRSGRHTIGLTTHGEHKRIARANLLAAADRAGYWPASLLLDHLPTTLATALAAGMVGRAGLVLTTLRHHQGEADGAVTRLADTLAACATLLRPAGRVIVTARRTRMLGALEDWPSEILAAADTAGLIPVQRCVALLAAIRGERLLIRASQAARRAVTRASRRGAPITLNAHHDVLVFAPDPQQARPGQQATSDATATAVAVPANSEKAVVMAAGEGACAS